MFIACFACCVPYIIPQGLSTPGHITSLHITHNVSEKPYTCGVEWKIFDSLIMLLSCEYDSSTSRGGKVLASKKSVRIDTKF